MLSCINLPSPRKPVPAHRSRTYCSHGEFGLSTPGTSTCGKFRHSTQCAPAKVNSGFLPPLFIQGTLLCHLLYFIWPQRMPKLHYFRPTRRVIDHDLQRRTFSYLCFFFFFWTHCPKMISQLARWASETWGKQNLMWRTLKKCGVSPRLPEGGQAQSMACENPQGPFFHSRLVVIPLNLHEQKLGCTQMDRGWS